MPLPEDDIAKIMAYCDNHLADPDWYRNEFDFIDDDKLRTRLGIEFRTARYVYKLGEALAATEEKLYAHVKFQIVQYASLYEAIIVYLLWNRFANHDAVIDIEYHETFKSPSRLANDISITNSDREQLYLYAKRKERTPRISIKFEDKVRAAKRIGFISDDLGKDICEFYRLRNAIHIENAIKKEIDYEIEQSALAYRRMRPFVDGIKEFLAKNQKDGVGTSQS